jgi:hypothetical protein
VVIEGIQFIHFNLAKIKLNWQKARMKIAKKQGEFGKSQTEEERQIQIGCGRDRE